jgi:Mn2+/Fe2+ NRAMP family transporter
MKENLADEVEDEVKKEGKLTLAWLDHLFPIPKKERRNIGHFFGKVKNGTISGAADIDPTTIITRIQAGATSGFSLLWMMLLSTPFLIAMEEITATLAVVTKKGFARLVKDQLGFKIAIFLAILGLISAIATIGADLGAMIDIIATATGVSNIIIVLMLFIIFVLLLFRGSYSFVSRFLFVLTPLFFLYIISALLAHPNWSQVAVHTFDPLLSMGKDVWVLAVALLGDVICPYIVFWQSTEEIEDGKTVADLKNENFGVRFGMIFCSIIFLFITVAAGAVLFKNGGLFINSARDAALALKPAVGNFSFLLFGIGILVSGLIAIPVLAASSAYLVADVMDWKEGLDKKLAQAKGFYWILIISLALGALINFAGFNPMKVVVYSQVLNGLLMPFILVVLLKLGFDKKIVGEHRPSNWIKFFAYATLIVFIILDIKMFLG